MNLTNKNMLISSERNKAPTPLQQRWSLGSCDFQMGWSQSLASKASPPWFSQSAAATLSSTWTWCPWGRRWSCTRPACLVSQTPGKQKYMNIVVFNWNTFGYLSGPTRWESGILEKRDLLVWPLAPLKVFHRSHVVIQNNLDTKFCFWILTTPILFKIFPMLCVFFGLLVLVII